jgi:peptidoglycan/xylan/chitin deacetylase (PgdA/CDA1 family)
MIYYSFGSRKEPKIALTFDDGPNPPLTNQILDILEENGVKANFFLLGKYAKENESTVKEIQRRGHLIGVHGYYHQRGVDPKFEVSLEIIEKITKEKPLFFRPPYGDLSLCKSDFFINNPQFKIVTFDVDPEDFKMIEPEIIINRVLEKVQNGSIIDLHDSSQHLEQKAIRPLNTLKALPRLIKELKNRGFLICRLDEIELVPLEF